MNYLELISHFGELCSVLNKIILNSLSHVSFVGLFYNLDGTNKICCLQQAYDKSMTQLLHHTVNLASTCL